MTIKQPTTYILTTLLLTACNQLRTTTYVEDHDLLHSMIYTQRHLLEIELSAQPIKETKRWSLLLKSHCDLLHRDFVYAEELPRQCLSSTDSTTQRCIASFHRCIGECPTFKRNCELCEQQAIQCQKPKD